jgi:phage terminase small subunit
MTTKILTKNKIKKKTIESMTSLGIYKKEYENVINIYVDTLYQYLKLNKDFEEGGFEYESYTAAGGAKKSPIVASLETLRKDILAYSDRLCLNPKSLETVSATENGNTSKLASVLSAMR